MGYFDAALISKNHLEHHGIKGQRWGVRRFQDYSGRRIGGSKGKNVTKVNKKHKFEDKNNVSINRRKEALNDVMSMWGATTMAAAMGAGMGVATGTGAIGAAVGAGVMSTHLAVISTAATIDFAVKDSAAKKADKKEKQFKEERAQNPIDKTTGFHKKTTEMSAEEDMERVNPGYKNWDENTKSNCTLCTMAYELRRRGYDVQAKKATSGYDADTLVKDWFPGAKPKTSEGSFDNQTLNEYYKRRERPVIDKETQKKMIEASVKEVTSQPDGARGQICVTWNGAFSGHSMAYANEGGKMVIYDSQANKRYEGKEAEKFLTKTSEVTITRLDNCDMNLKYIKEVAE